MNKQRHFLKLGISGVLYVAATLLSGFAIRQLATDDVWRIPLAVLPALPALAMIAAIVRHVLRMDELEQRIHATAALVTLLIIMAGGTCYGFLESYAGFPQVSMFWPVMVGFAGWSMLHPRIRRMYA